jgi:hypothetical protein
VESGDIALRPFVYNLRVTADNAADNITARLEEMSDEEQEGEGFVLDVLSPFPEA